VIAPFRPRDSDYLHVENRVSRSEPDREKWYDPGALVTEVPV